MNKTVIKVEGLGKQYRLGQIGTGTMSEDLNRWWHTVRGKEDPLAKVGEVNDRTIKGKGNLVWALKNINFEVKQGDVLGIIGKNGAGKSTLLKVLSRVTSPTEGDIKVKGRIASLLEVGTGFHPELTGKENIYLNGAILGMTKKEINSKLEEIIDFSGVERYIDTPVKRYSSGMYVRLAFAVAAHLDPEILIIDEVLAVGDAEFQKKCMGKMKAVSGEGRTVLFVSHNLSSIKTLCTTGLYLQNGQIHSSGNIAEILTHYKRSSSGNFQISSESNLAVRMSRCAASSRFAGHIRFNSIQISNSIGEVVTNFRNGEKIFVKIEYQVFKNVDNLQIVLRFESADSFDLISSNSFVISEKSISSGKNGTVLITLNSASLKDGDYLPYLVANTLNGEPYDVVDRMVTDVPIIEVQNENIGGLVNIDSEMKIVN